MDWKESSPRLHVSSLSVSTSYTSPAAPFVEPPSTLASPLNSEFTGHSRTATIATTTFTLFDDDGNKTDLPGFDRRSSTLIKTVPESPDYTVSPLTALAIGAASAPHSSRSAQVTTDGSSGYQAATSYVLNGTHEGATTAAAPSSTKDADVKGSRSTVHLLTEGEEQEQEEDQDNVISTISTTTSATSTTTPATSLVQGERTSVVIANSLHSNIDNPEIHTAGLARNCRSPPTSASTTSSSASGRRRIAESSMILSTGAGPSSSAFAANKGGSLSPAWSMASIPRDISATYSKNYQDSSESPTAGTMDERLYGLVDRYGFLVEEGRTPTLDRNSAKSSTPSSSRRPVRALSEAKNQARTVEKEQERSLKWARMAKQYTSDAKETEYSFANHPKFVSRVYKGIPDCWRAAAWSYLITKRSAGFDPNIRQVYHDMLDISSPEEEQIDLDVPRTMHGHIMFRTRYGPGQCALFKVLKAYSNYNHRVGYCQGMASVVATMLTFFDEEKAFVLLTQLFDRYGINDLVVPGFPALFEAFYIQEELTKIYAPKVFEALEKMGIATPSYASRWYITLYSAGVVPYRTLLRIWDIFLLEGFDWLYFMALALLKYHEPVIVQNNFEQTMEMLNAKMDIQDDDRLINTARKLCKQGRRAGTVVKLKNIYAANMTHVAATTAGSRTSP
ncbi:hypothetical protein BGZ99_007667 [Dissophora globulifera]|uniref:Rab-GAP TBC domain-containing protein n=1 Tax=Dissophora globulifera TaxID=979702 RepID=A0A9P6UQG7_9FUNG|nr:hypothetical protein BGZ99_007667 [Dissophora globulifera]